MNTEAGPKVLSQDDAHIHAPKRVGLDQNLSGPKHRGHRARPVGITPPDDDSSEACGRIRVAEKNDIDAV